MHPKPPLGSSDPGLLEILPLRSLYFLSSGSLYHSRLPPWVESPSGMVPATSAYIWSMESTHLCHLSSPLHCEWKRLPLSPSLWSVVQGQSSYSFSYNSYIPPPNLGDTSSNGYPWRRYRQNTLSISKRILPPSLFQLQISIRWRRVKDRTAFVFS